MSPREAGRRGLQPGSPPILLVNRVVILPLQASVSPPIKMDVIGTTFYNSSVVSMAHDSHLAIVCDESVH